jgi:hypothetical protein
VKRGPVAVVVGIPSMPKFDPRAAAATDAALEQMRRSKPLVPPHAHDFVAGKCRRCGKRETRR